MTRRTPLEVATPELRVVLACRDRPCVGTDAAVWSSDRGPGGPKNDAVRAAEAAREAAALAICTPCPVRYECVTHALAVEAWLVWGGFDMARPAGRHAARVWLQLAAEIAADDGDQPGRRNQPTQWRGP